MNVSTGALRGSGSVLRPPRIAQLLLLLAFAAVVGLGASPSRAEPPGPSVNAGIVSDGVWLSNWTPGSSVTVEIGGVTRTVVVDGAGNAWISRQIHGQDIVAGLTITAGDAVTGTTKSLTVVDLRITSVDLAADTVTGTAPAGAAVHVSVNQPTGPPLGQADTIANSSGNWTVSFAGSVDVAYGVGVSAGVADADGDTTLADRFLQLPWVGAWINGDQVALNNWAPGVEVTLQIGGHTRTVTVDGAGNAWIERQTHGQDITVGTTVTANAGGLTKTLVVADLRITSVDVDADTVTGVAPAGADVHVSINQWPGPQLGQAQTTALPDGSWSVSFAGTVDLRLGVGIGVGANVADADGDNTFADRQLLMPSVGAWIDGDQVALTNWTPGSTVTLDIGGAIRTVTVDGWGNGFVQRQVHGQDVVSGMTIAATEGGLTKTLLVADLRITSVDMTADIVDGIAPPNALVHVGINQQGMPQPVGQADVTAGATGNWSVDFHGIVDITFGMGINANVSDADYDTTTAGKFLPRPGIVAHIDSDQVDLYGWTPGSEVAVTIGNATRTVTIGEFGGGWISRDAHGQDLVGGMTITATEGATAKTLVVADLAIGSVDPAADTVGGTATPGAAVTVGIWQPPNQGMELGSTDTQADGAGNWTASLTGIVDITPSMGASARITDPDGDSTQFTRGVGNVSASLNDWIGLNGWIPGSTVTLNIGGVIRMVTVNRDGNASVEPQVHGQDVVSGMTITATDGALTKTLVVADLRITSVDMAADTVTGVAPPNALVHVGLDVPGAPNVETPADATGAWSISFEGTVDIDYGMGIGADVTDADGDVTFTGTFLQRPFIGAWVAEDGISLHGWIPGSTVTLDIGGVGLAVAVEEGGTWIDRDQHGQDLVPGLTITATDGTTTKSLVVTDIVVTGVDTTADTVSGLAEAGATVGVGVWQPPTEEPPLGWTSTEADGGGNWTVSFAGVVDITPTTAVTANVADADGDVTNLHRYPGAPTADAGGPYTVAEGSCIELQGSGTGGVEPLRYEWLGAGDALDDPGRATPRLKAGDDGELTLTLVVTDAAGMSGSDETTVTVTNRPPVVSPLGVDTSSKRRIQVGALFVDPGRFDTHTALVRWGDGSESPGTVKETSGMGAVAASHEYARKGTYTVTLTVRDDDGDARSVQRQVTVR